VSYGGFFFFLFSLFHTAKRSDSASVAMQFYADKECTRLLVHGQTCLSTKAALGLGESAPLTLFLGLKMGWL
jgi:hypothetical protein